MPLVEFVVHFKTRKPPAHFKNAFVYFNSSKGDNGFENILK